jgi:hypothetical protein
MSDNTKIVYAMAFVSLLAMIAICMTTEVRW